MSLIDEIREQPATLARLAARQSELDQTTSNVSPGMRLRAARTWARPSSESGTSVAP